jgi:hypothetical protein
VRARVLTSVSHDLKNGHGRIKWPYKSTSLQAGGTLILIGLIAAGVIYLFIGIQ